MAISSRRLQEKKLELSTRSGDPGGNPKPKWKFFESLSFLNDLVKYRKTTSNIYFDEENHQCSPPMELAPDETISIERISKSNDKYETHKYPKRGRLEEAMNEALNVWTRRAQVAEREDDDEIFGKSIARQLRTLTDRNIKSKAKLQIQKVSYCLMLVVCAPYQL